MNKTNLEKERFFYNGSKMLKLKHEQLIDKIHQGDLEACMFYLDLMDIEYNENNSENNEQS